MLNDLKFPPQSVTITNAYAYSYIQIETDIEIEVLWWKKLEQTKYFFYLHCAHCARHETQCKAVKDSIAT